MRPMLCLFLSQCFGARHMKMHAGQILRVMKVPTLLNDWQRKGSIICSVQERRPFSEGAP